ncbi:MAG: DUF4433 domain-containing protein [Tissierellia bacterium]|nr:DUF4433 domain-containing protein [Tissierellia bacterium]
MLDKIRIGDQLFHKYLGIVFVTDVKSGYIVAETKSNGELPFIYNDIGKVLFFNKDHIYGSYKSYLEYFDFYEQENEKKEKEKKLKEERLEKEKEKIRVRKLEDDLNILKQVRRQHEAMLTKEKEKKEKEIRQKTYEEEHFLSHVVNINELFGGQSIGFEYDFEISKDNRERVREILNKRGIRHLVHFTRLENLSSILSNGLIPVSIQKNMGIESFKNDCDRLDNQLNCTSCSVEFPNYKLFYKFRCQYPSSSWVILLLSTDVLLSEDNIAYYCQSNAASLLPKIRNIRGLLTHISFEEMFRGVITTKDNRIINRNDLDISDSLTTDPQAEILISDIISTNHIKEVCFKSQEEMKEFINKSGRKIINKFDCSIRPDLFDRRKDFIFW